MIRVVVPAAVTVLLAVLGVLFLLVCIGEKKFENKVLYAAVAMFMFVLLLVSGGS